MSSDCICYPGMCPQGCEPACPVCWASDTGARESHGLTTIRDYLEWQQAIHGGGSTEAQHRALVKEGRPKPSLEDALAAVDALADEGLYGSVDT